MKTKLKAYTAGFLTCLMIVSTIAWAATGNGVIKEVFYGVRVVVNGIEQDFAEDMQPFITGGRTFLPVRGIADALDLPVDWDEDTSTVYIGRRPGQARDDITHLNIITTSLPVSLDPHQSSDIGSGIAARNIFNTLLVLCYDTMEVLPSLAINWHMTSAQTVEIELRRGVYFHNGDRLTAHDVKFSLERAAQSHEGGFIAGAIDYVTVYDDYNLTIFLQFPFAPILRNLTDPMASIVPMDYVLDWGEDILSWHPIGTGPFMFDLLHIGESLELRRNPYYWGTPPQIETLAIRGEWNPDTRLMMIEDGTADINLNLFMADLAIVDASPFMTVVREPSLAFEYIGFNLAIEPWSNPLVMQAMNYALDAQFIIDHVYYGVGTPITSPLPYLAWGHTEVEPFTTNIERARELLAEAGYADGFGRPVEFWWNFPNWQRQQIAELVQYTLAQLNIEVIIIEMEWATLLELTAWGGEHDMFVLGWTVTTGDPDFGLFTMFHSHNIGAPGNRTFVINRDLDRLLEAGRAEIDPVRRAAIYADILQLLRDHPPTVPLRQIENLAAISNDVRGLILSPTGRHNFAGVYFGN